MASPPVHILVVDDQPDLRESMTEVLEDSGYAVACASDGLRALAYLGSSAPKPHLILLDLRMPNMDGLQFREEQLRRSEYASIPVVVMTGDAHLKEKATSLHVSGFITKPVVIDTLLALIARVLKGTFGTEGN